MNKKAKHLQITGRVQGVCYRAWTIETAEKLGLTGWVRNRLDGSVEALAIGNETDINTLIIKCKNGPTLAHVDHITITDADIENFTTFEFRPTA